MSSRDAVLVAEDVGKKYTVRAERSFLLGFNRRRAPEELWALRHFNLELRPGELISVIGRNGAGKSTFLKLAAGVASPSEGRLHRPPHVAPLIEVGAGFHPEMTGRENIEINARMLGLSRAQINRTMDDVIDFAGLRHAIDQPVKQYSSGMFMRLGFSVAVHTDPEVLVVDEVLAVGDRLFQLQCMDRIIGMRDRGVGIVFVSHDLSTVQTLSDKVFLLDKGTLIASGNPGEVVGAYHALLETPDQDSDHPLSATKVVMTHAGAPAPDLWSPGQRAEVRITVRAEQDTPAGVMALWMTGGLGTLSVWSAYDGPYLPPLRAGEEIDVDLGVTLAMSEGLYFLNFGVVSEDKSTELLVRQLGQLAVAPRPGEGQGSVVDLDPSISVDGSLTRGRSGGARSRAPSRRPRAGR